MNSSDEDPETRSEFSERTIALLQEAGWYPGRCISLRDFERVLEAEGYAVFPSVKEFLAEFGGLSIGYRYEPSYEDRLNFDAAAAAGAIFADVVLQYAERLGKPLCVIGEYYANHYTIMMDPVGTVYGAFDDILNLLGTSGSDAIENIISGQNIEPIV